MSITTLQSLLKGKSPHQFSQDFVYSYQSRRTDFTSPKSNENKRKSNKSVVKNLGNVFKPMILDENEDDKMGSTCAEQSIELRNEILKKINSKGRNEKEEGFLYKLCLEKIKEENLQKNKLKTNSNNKKEQAEFCERLSKERLLFEFNIEAKATILKESERTKCTFSPKINKNYNFENYNSDQFYEYQIDWENQRNKKELLRKETENTGVPKISNNSQKLAENKIQEQIKSQNVYDRLFEIKKNKIVDEKKKKFDENSFITIRKEDIENSFTFSPKINKKSKCLAERKASVDNPQRHYKCVCKECININNCSNLFDSKIVKNLSMIGENPRSPSPLKKSNDLFLRSFIKKFNEEVKNQFNGHFSNTIHFKDLENILFKLGFLTRECQYYGRYLEEIWKFLSTSKNVIFIPNLLIFLFAVMNLKIDANTITDIYPEIGLASNYINFNKFSNCAKINDYEILIISQDDVQKIHKDFQELYLYRISKIKEKKMINEPFQKNKLSEINQKLSQNRKEKYERKYLTANTSDFYEYELLRNYEKDTHLNSIKESLFQKELVHCTFTPKLKERKSSGNLKQRPPLSSPKSFHWEKRDRDPMDIDYEKNGIECTFQPHVEQRERTKTFSNIETIGFDKAVGRLKNARINKEVTEEIKNRGTTTSEEKWEEIKNMVEEKIEAKNSIQHAKQTRKIHEDLQYNKTPFEQYELNINDKKDLEKVTVEPFILNKHNAYNNPLLYVDVNMNLGKKRKILVFQDDSPEEIAKEFSNQYGLDETTLRRLTILLREKIMVAKEKDGQEEYIN